jgi:hypothetical protein
MRAGQTKCIQVDRIVAGESVQVDQFGLVGHFRGSLPFGIEPLTNQRIVDAITADMDVPRGWICDTSTPVDRHVQVGIGIVNDVTVRGADQFADHFTFLAENDRRSAATITSGDVVAMAKDLEVHQVVEFVVSQRCQSKIPRAKYVSHLMATLWIGVEKLRHIAMLVPPSD